jgi:hypothetical protein
MLPFNFNVRISTGRSLGYITISIIISWVLATSINLDKYELGAIYNLLLPPLVGIITIMLFLIANALVKNAKKQLMFLAICCLINLYTGILFHFELSNLPFGR